MSDVSVGVVSLDLVLKDQISGMLNKYVSNIKNALNKPLQEMSDSVGKGFDKAFDSIGKTAEKMSDTVKKPMKTVEKVMNDTAESMKQGFEDSSIYAEGVLEKCFGDMAAESKKRNDAIQADLNKTTEKLSKPIPVTFTAEQLAADAEVDKITKNFKEGIDKAVDETVSKVKESIGNFEVSADPVKRLEQELQNTEEKIGLVNARWQELQSSLANAQTDEEAAKICSELNKVEGQMIRLKGSAEKLNDKIASMPKSANPSSLKDRFKSVFSSIFDNAKSITKKAASAVKNVFGGAFNKVKSIGGKAMDHVKSKISGMKQAANGVSKPFNQLGKSLRRAAKSVFLMAGAYAVFRGLKSAISDVCNNNEEFKKSLNEVKANLQVAFTPIINAIMPAINTLMSGLAALTKGFATFVNELFGTTYKKSLEACKKVQKVGKEAKKNSQTYLAAFDEMNVAQDTAKDSDSGIDYDAINGDNVKLPDWAQRMKEAIKTGDWKGVGALFAEKVNAAMDAVNWNKIQAKVNGFMKSLAEGLNGFIEKLNWKKLGQSVGNGINTVFGGIYTFMKKFKWGTLGKGFANGLNGMIRTINWKLIGATLASKWNALIDFLFNFVTTFDWSAFGKSLSEAVNSWFNEIDWAKAGETISDGIKGILDSAIAFLADTDWEQVGGDIAEFITNIDWIGIAEKIMIVIKEALSAALDIVKEFLSKTVSKLSDWFDGLSPSARLLAGAIATLTTAIAAYKAITTVATVVQNGLNLAMKARPIGIVISAVVGLVAAFVLLWKKCDWFRNFWKGLWNGIKSVCSVVVDKIKSVLSAIIGWVKTYIVPIVSKIINNLVDRVKAIIKIFKGVIDFIKGVFTGDWKKAWEGIKDIFKGVWDLLFGIIKAPINLIIKGLNWLWGAIYDAVAGIVNTVGDIVGWVGDIFGCDWGFSIPEDPPLIPYLAKGGLATAPTLAVVGDNRNAKADPEVIAPLSKLEGMLGDNSKVEQLLQEIIVILKTLDLTFEGKIDERTLWKTIVKLVREERVRTGGALF